MSNEPTPASNHEQLEQDHPDQAVKAFSAFQAAGEEIANLAAAVAPAYEALPKPAKKWQRPLTRKQKRRIQRQARADVRKGVRARKAGRVAASAYAVKPTSRTQ